MMKLPLGIDDYKELIEEIFDHIDKSLFIKAFLDENNKAVLITRSRRFGKTMNMSMLYYFLSNHNAEVNRQLFIGKQIETAQTNDGHSCMEYQGQYPTIFLSFKDIRPKSFEDFKEQIAHEMAEIYEEHQYLEESEKLSRNEKSYFTKIIDGVGCEVDLQRSLKRLSIYLRKYYDKKVIILLDEYDTPFHAAYINQTPFHEEISDFMKIYLGSAFKGNKALRKSMITGILRVSLMDLFSGFNMVSVKSMLTSGYAEYFGFTRLEAQNLIRVQSAGLSEAETSSRIDIATQWYNGYLIGNIQLYNPWSVISYLDQGCVADSYWNATGEDSVLGKTLLENSTFDMKNKLVSLLNGEILQVRIDDRTVFADISRNEGALWGLMLYSGYLKVTGDNGNNLEDREYQIAIPNLEVKHAYKKMVRDWFKSIGESAYHQLFNSLQTSNLAAFKQLLENYLYETVSYHDLGKKTLEKVYHVMFLGMFFMLGGQYTVDSNKEYGLGRYDLILVPKDKSKRGYIFEFKATDNASTLSDEVESALLQITESHYGARLRQEGVSQAHHVGIAFCGKEMLMDSQLHDYRQQPVLLTSSTTTLFSATSSSIGSSSLDSSTNDMHEDKKHKTNL